MTPSHSVYLTECRDVLEWAVLDHLIIFARVAQLGVTLDSFRGEAHAGGLATGEVRRIQIVIALEHHQLSLGLRDVSGERREHVAEHCLHLHTQLSTSCQGRGQMYLEECPTARERETASEMDKCVFAAAARPSFAYGVKVTFVSALNSDRHNKGADMFRKYMTISFMSFTLLLTVHVLNRIYSIL